MLPNNATRNSSIDQIIVLRIPEAQDLVLARWFATEKLNVAEGCP